MSTPAIGTVTNLTDREWIKAFIASLDEDGDHCHETFEFLRDNRFTDDGSDEELKSYQQLCREHDIQF